MDSNVTSAAQSNADIEKTVAEIVGGGKKKKKKINRSKLCFMLVCTLPVFALYLIFKIYPLFNMFYISFFEWSGFLSPKKFIGFDNYVNLFTNTAFGNAILNSLIYIVVSTAFTIILAMVFATLLSKGRVKGKAFYRVVYYFPNILSVVVIGSLFMMLFASNGPINNILMSFGWIGQQINFLQVYPANIWVILIVMIWQAVGYYMVMYIAGMDSIPDSLYESASLDGANAVVKFFKITIPLTWEVIRVTLTFFVISSINMSFLFISTMIGFDGNASADNLLNMLDRNVYSNYYGYGMAVGTVLFLITFIVTLIIQRVTKKEAIEA